MSRRGDVAGPDLRVRRNLHRPGSVMGRYARRDPLDGLDGHGECGRAPGPVIGHHRRQPKPVDLVAGERQADQATAIAGHEVDRFGRGEFGGDDQVAFIFAILVINQDHHAAFAQLVQGLR